MDEESKSKDEGRTGANVGKDIKKELPSIPATVIKVITNPVGFYREMPKTGGFLAPLVFMVLLGVAGGLVQAVLAIVGLNPVGVFMAIALIVIVPILIVIFGFIGAAILFIIWKIMGSQESFETAYRSIAYASAITPLTAVLNVIPYVGVALGLVWMTYLIIVASIEIHKIKPKLAWIVFGTICVVFSLISISVEYAGRRLAGEMKAWQKEIGKGIGDMEDMTTEEAGKALGEFMKGLKKATEEE